MDGRSSFQEWVLLIKEDPMKGYYTDSGYRGLVNGIWMEFENDTEYKNYVKENEDE